MSSKKLALLVGAAAIETAIAKLGKTQAKFEQELHLVACSALAHVAEHNNPAVLNRLLDTIGKRSVRTNALREWAVAFGNVEYSMETKSMVYKRGKVANVEAAMDKPFWEFKPEPEFTPFDFKAQLAALLAKAEKAAKDSRNDVPAELLMQARELARAQGVTVLQ